MARDFGPDVREQRIIEPGDAKERGRVPLPDGFDQLRTAEAGGQDDGRTARQHGQNADRERIGMMKRQRHEGAVMRADNAFHDQGFDIRHQVRMAERHRFRRSGRAGGEGEDRDIIRIGGRKKDAGHRIGWFGLRHRPDGIEIQRLA